MFCDELSLTGNLIVGSFFLLAAVGSFFLFVGSWGIVVPMLLAFIAGRNVAAAESLWRQRYGSRPGG